MTLALAAAAVVLLAAAAAGWWQHDRVRQAEALRAAALDGKVEAALDEAADHLNRNDWSGAAAAATRAEELRDSGASGRWAGRLDEMRADVELVTRLDEARLLQTEFDSDREGLSPCEGHAPVRRGVRPVRHPRRLRPGRGGGTHRPAPGPGSIRRDGRASRTGGCSP